MFTNPIIEAEAILKQTITQNVMKRLNTIKTSVIGGKSSSSSLGDGNSHVVGLEDDGNAAKKARTLN